MIEFQASYAPRIVGDDLRVAASSPTNLQAVLDAAVKSAVRFEGAEVAAVHPRPQEMLETDRAEVVEVLVEAEPVLSGALIGTELDDLAELVTRYDFGAALECLAGIAGRLSLKLGQPALFCSTS